MQTQTLKRVFLNNGAQLTDPDSSMSPAAVKDFFSTMYPELLNAEIQGPEVTATELVFTFQRTTGTKGRKAKEIVSEESRALQSFVRRLDIAAGEAATPSRLVPSQKLVLLQAMLVPKFGDQALQLPAANCPLLV